MSEIEKEGMEKRNVIEDGRTPEDGIKIAEEVEKTAAELSFDNITKETDKDESSNDKGSSD